MANRPAISIEGLREVRQQLRDLNDRVGKEMLRDAHRRLAARVVKMAEPRVPVKTGALAGSLRGLGSVTGATGKAGGAKVPYAAAIHWGVGPRPGMSGPHNIEARPFLLEALNRVDLDAAGEFAHQLSQLLRRLKGL